VEDERRRRRRELVALLLRDPPTEEADLRAAAAGAGWRLPRTAAALAVPEAVLDRLVSRLPADTLTARIEGVGCAVVPDPEGPGRAAEIERAVDGGRPGAGRDRPATAAALGPAGSLRDLAGSWSLARATLRAIEAGAIEVDDRLVRSDDALGVLLLFENRALVERIAERRLAPLRELTPKARARMEETALAYVQERGNAAAMARALDVHPQTARYRLGRLRELLGDALDDPDARFEIELALRGRR
jgi:PucR C-terminal helix-turn-helix domain